MSHPLPFRHRFSPLVFSVLVVLTCGIAHAGPTGSVDVTIIDPSASDIIHKQVLVIAEVDSTFELDTVIADIDGRTANLTFDSDEDWWLATVDVSDGTWGPMNLTVTATDVFANQDSQSFQVMFDLPPVVTLVAPQDWDVVGETFQVIASCQDDDPVNPCTRVDMRFTNWSFCAPGGTLVGNNGPDLNKTATFPPFNLDTGRSISTCVFGFDSAGQTGGEPVHLWYVDNPDLHEVDETAGLILDATEERLLFVTESDPGGGVPVGERIRATGVETIVADDPGVKIDELDAQLSSVGVFAPFLVLDSGWKPHLFDWRSDGTLFDYTVTFSSLSVLEANGEWALWSQEDLLGGSYHLIRRDLVNETDFTVSTQLGGGATGTSDGAVYFVESGSSEITKYDGVTFETVIGEPGVLYGSPQTDGGLIAYLKRIETSPGVFESSLAVLLDGIESVIEPDDPSFSVVYQVAGDWIAFTRPGGTGQKQVWKRAPDGTETQLSFFSTSSFLKSISSHGDVIFTHGAKEYLHTIYSAGLIDLGYPVYNKSFWLNNRLYRSFGRKLFEVPIEVFSGDFEGGDTTLWSVVVP